MKLEIEQYTETLTKMCNQELWLEFLVKQAPDDYDGQFTNRGAGERLSTEEEMETRLDEWLAQPKTEEG